MYYMKIQRILFFIGFLMAYIYMKVENARVYAVLAVFFFLFSFVEKN